MNRTLALRAGQPAFHNFLVVLPLEEVSLVPASVVLAPVQKDGRKSCMATMAELAAPVLCNIVQSPFSNLCSNTVRAVADEQSRFQVKASLLT
jgi:hypothetical protein